MEIYNVLVLRELIRKSGLKQAYLSHGICDIAHLSNVLNHKRKLSAELFRDLLLKMGHDPADYLHIQNLDDIEQIEKLCRLRGLQREKSGNFLDQCAKLIEELEPHAHTFTATQHQDVVGTKINVLFYEQDYSTVRALALQGLSLTRPTLFPQLEGGIVFETICDQLPKMILSHREAALFIKLAIGYGADPSASIQKHSNLRIANTILEKLWQSLGQLPDYSYEIVNVKVVCLYNYTKSLYMISKHRLAIKLCDVGIQLCKRYWDGEHLPMFIGNKGDNLIELGQKKAGQALLVKACLLFEGAERTRELHITQERLAKLNSDG